MKRFTAVTYNVLAQSYAHRDRYPLSPPAALEAESRHRLLLARIAQFDADLLCFQELEPAIYEAARAGLDATHHAAYVQRQRGPDGAAIFARRTHFDWLGHDVLHYQSHQPGKHHYAVIANLAISGHALRVACTHLAWHPESTPLAEHTGYQQMRELVAHRDATAPRAIWIFAGDFNAISQSAVVGAALDSGMDESCRTQRPWDTCAINGRPRKIDYLLFSTGRLVPRPGVLPKLSRDTALPSLTEPSDHLPVRVDFELTGAD